MGFICAKEEERLVLRKDVFQDCLILYPESVWFKTQNQLRHLSHNKYYEFQ